MGLYEEIWMSGAFAKNYNFDLEERTYFAVETDAGNPGMFNGARLVTKGGTTHKRFKAFDLLSFKEEGIN